MNFEQQLISYIPFNEQEAVDRDAALRCLKQPDIYLRTNELVHVTSSAWIVNHDRTKVLMAYHNIMQTWAWLGGHADGETDLLQVALKEAREESGIQHVHPISEDLFSVEMLTEFVLVTQSCPTLCYPMDCSPQASLSTGILQARILEWIAMPSSRRFS